jgi:hypothetical protein
MVSSGPLALSGESLAQGAQHALEQASSALVPLAEIPKRWWGGSGPPSEETETKWNRTSGAVGASSRDELGGGASGHAPTDTRTFIDKFILYENNGSRKKGKAARIYGIGDSPILPKSIDITKAKVDTFYKGKPLGSMSLKMFLKHLNEDQSIVLGHPLTPPLERMPSSAAQHSAQIEFVDQNNETTSLARFAHMFVKARENPYSLDSAIRSSAQLFKRKEANGQDWAMMRLNGKLIHIPWSRLLSGGFESMRQRINMQQLKERFTSPDLLVDLRFYVRSFSQRPSLQPLAGLTYHTYLHALETGDNPDEAIESNFAQLGGGVPVFAGPIRLKDLAPRDLGKFVSRYLYGAHLDEVEDEIFFKLDTSRERYISSDITRAINDALTAQ